MKNIFLYLQILRTVWQIQTRIKQSNNRIFFEMYGIALRYKQLDQDQLKQAPFLTVQEAQKYREMLDLKDKCSRNLCERNANMRVAMGAYLKMLWQHKPTQEQLDMAREILELT
jgi:hypothetical protein